MESIQEPQEIDYEKIGLKCGLEIHQQLDTKKLFCNCPSILRKDEADYKIKRKLHLVAGESGEVDVAAKYEASLDKEFIYEAYKDTNCLVELDEEPPHEINKEALEIALQISLMLNAKILPITQIMRKTVVDGSNTSGFQRTVLIAQDGFVETSFGKVGIATICLEEDSARIISKEGNVAVYRLDRLGIPLVEIATKAEIKNPSQAKETALKIGEILRKCKVKRGIGTIRQDINLSIKGSSRIELKGFQDIRNIEKAIEIEVKRQLDLIKKNQSAPEVRKVLADGTSEFLRPLPGPSRMYPETDLPLLKISRDIINKSKKNLKPKEEKIEGLNQEMVSLLFKEKKFEDFKELSKIFYNPKLIFKMLLIYPKEISSRKKIKNLEKKFSLDVLSSIIENIKKGVISEGQIKNILEKIAEGEDLNLIIKKSKPEEIENLEEEIIKIIKQKPGLSFNAYMGLIMKKFEGKFSGKEISDLLKKHFKT
ncbi:MAG: hypothetical protein KatS3mg001_205 [Candidatus Pacearchaeota archaeon]|nr:MAG: hypothetical protein KatS3mg001_205 [Candidatus Pacearchaeota archaeon]